MAVSYECRSKLVKQLPPKPTKRRGELNTIVPGPETYVPPELIGGKGYSHIKRAPAYSIGHKTPLDQAKSARIPNAPLYNIHGLGEKGRVHIPGGVVATRLNYHKTASEIPGPGAYEGKDEVRHRRPPAYTMSAPAPPKKEPWNMWTPSPNFYLPPIAGKKEPAFSMGNASRGQKPPQVPGPGDHNPNFNYVRKTMPKFSIAGARARPAPKTHVEDQGPGYCWKKFTVVKKSAPAYSFGIKHSPYLGQQVAYLQSSDVDLQTP